MSDGTRAVLAAIAAAAVAAGCRDQPRPGAAPITIRVDGTVAGRVTADELAVRRPLGAGVPATGAIALLDARTLDGRRLTVPDPGARYPDHEVALYLDDGRPTLGIFRASRPDQPAHVQRALAVPALALVGVSEIDVATRVAPPVDAGPLAPTGLTVVIGGRPLELTAARLDALTVHGDEQRGPKHGGWQLADVLALAGVTDWRRLTVVGREGRRDLDRGQLGGPGVTAFVRRNRRGELRIAIGQDGGTDLIELHEVTRIDVTAGP